MQLIPGVERDSMGRSVRRPNLIALGRREGLVVGLTLALIGVLTYWAFDHPAVWLYDCEHRFLPSLEARYGFKGGRMRTPRPNDDYLYYGLVAIEPKGAFEKAQFRAGDIPVAHHGGFSDFCGAMHIVEGGEESWVYVLRAPEYDWEHRQRLTIPFVPKL